MLAEQTPSPCNALLQGSYLLLQKLRYSVYRRLLKQVRLRRRGNAPEHGRLTGDLPHPCAMES